MRTLLFAVLVMTDVLAQPTEVISGTDLAEWQALEERRPDGDKAVELYRSYIVKFPTSSLAEVAWGRLVELDATAGDWSQHPAIKPHLFDLQQSWKSHQRALARTPSDIVVAELNASTTVPPVTERWTCARSGAFGAPALTLSARTTTQRCR